MYTPKANLVRQRKGTFLPCYRNNVLRAFQVEKQKVKMAKTSKIRKAEILSLFRLVSLATTTNKYTYIPTYMNTNTHIHEMCTFLDDDQKSPVKT